MYPLQLHKVAVEVKNKFILFFGLGLSSAMLREAIHKKMSQLHSTAFGGVFLNITAAIPG